MYEQEGAAVTERLIVPLIDLSETWYALQCFINGQAREVSRDKVELAGQGSLAG